MYRGKADQYREATLGPRIVDGVEAELTGMERAVAKGRDLKALGAGRYELTAPSTALNGSEGVGGSVQLVLSVSADGYLEKVRRAEGEGSFVFIETFTDFGRSFGITPPPPEVIAEGPVKRSPTSPNTALSSAHPHWAISPGAEPGPGGRAE